MRARGVFCMMPLLRKKKNRLFKPDGCYCSLARSACRATNEVNEGEFTISLPSPQANNINNAKQFDFLKQI